MKLLMATAAMLLFAPCAFAEKPTETGDVIGSITMAADRSVTVRLRSVECNGMIAETQFTVKPGEPRYQSNLDYIGGLAPLETKPIHASPVKPCPDMNRLKQ